VSNQSRLLITRFEPHAQLLADKLNAIGCFTIAQPLLTVMPLTDPKILNRFLSLHYDLVIAVSGNAVKYAQQQVTEQWPKATYIAVGQSTQKQLSVATEQNVLCPEESFDSEGLLALKALQSIQSKRILIIRGEGGRDFLENELKARGAVVHFFQTYKRVKIDLNGHELVKNWLQAQINGVIISSIEILNQLFSIVPSNYVTWLSGLTLYVPSQRVADQAAKLGAKHVVLLPSLQTEKIVEFFNMDNGHCI